MRLDDVMTRWIASTVAICCIIVSADAYGQRASASSSPTIVDIQVKLLEYVRKTLTANADSRFLAFDLLLTIPSAAWELSAELYAIQHRLVGSPKGGTWDWGDVEQVVGTSARGQREAYLDKLRLGIPREELVACLRIGESDFNSRHRDHVTLGAYCSQVSILPYLEGTDARSSVFGRVAMNCGDSFWVSEHNRKWAGMTLFYSYVASKHFHRMLQQLRGTKNPRLVGEVARLESALGSLRVPFDFETMLDNVDVVPRRWGGTIDIPIRDDDWAGRYHRDAIIKISRFGEVSFAEWPVVNFLSLHRTIRHAPNWTFTLLGRVRAVSDIELLRDSVEKALPRMGARPIIIADGSAPGDLVELVYSWIANRAPAEDTPCVLLLVSEEQGFICVPEGYVQLEWSSRLDGQPLTTRVERDSERGIGAGMRAGLGKKGSKRVGQLKLDSVASSGFCKKDDIHTNVLRRAGAILACYEAQLQIHESLAGKATIRWTIDQEGKVVGTIIASSTLGNSAVEKCVPRVIRAMRFQKPERGVCVVEWSFNFNPE